MSEKNDIPRVLVAIPTYNGKDYIFEEFMKRISEFTYENYDILIVDSSAQKGGPFYKKSIKYMKGNAKKKEVIAMRRSDTGRQTLCKARNIIRKYMLDDDYEYMFHLESDLIPPKNIIEFLMSQDKIIITGMYEIGKIGKNFYFDVGKPWAFAMSGKFPLIHQTFPKKEKWITKDDKFITKEGVESTSKVFVRQLNRKEMDLFIDGTIKQVTGCGLGCTLIERQVLEHFKFRINIKYNFHDDTLFYADLFNARVPVFLHTGLNIRHDNQDWADIKKQTGYKY